jgi:GAF domain-containing protein
MDSGERSTAQNAQSEAQGIIEAQAEEIKRLRREVEANRAAVELREALVLGTTVGTIMSPVSHSQLLEMIVGTAVHVISARAGSLLLVDRETRELVFEAVVGGKSAELRKTRMPLGRGIVGLVAATGQALAVSDARDDPRVARDIQERIGYFPDSLLCVPLLYDGQTIGVFELVDKEGAAFFSTTDMQILGYFAQQAAVAIEQSRAHQGITAIVNEVVQSLSGISAPRKQELQQRVSTLAANLEEKEAVYRDALRLATLVKQIVWQGEHERKLCETILDGFAEFLQHRQPAVGAMLSLP